MEEWMKLRDDLQSCQKQFREMMLKDLKDHGHYLNPANTRTGFVMQNRTLMGHLPTPRFLNGYSYFVVKLHELFGLKPYMVHMVWGYGGRETKMYKMREGQFAYDAPDYYNQPQLVSFEYDAPAVTEAFAKAAVPRYTIMPEEEQEVMVDFHIKAMDTQLSYLWHAFGVSLALNRTIVMPELKCYCVRNWFRTENCRLTGDYLTRLPFTCSIDQVRGLSCNASTCMLEAATTMSAADTRVEQHATLVLMMVHSVQVRGLNNS
jgi:hypothetical protein